MLLGTFLRLQDMDVTACTPDGVEDVALVPQSKSQILSDGLKRRKLLLVCSVFASVQYPNAVILLFFPVLEATVRGHLPCINSSGLHHKKDKSVNCTAIWST